MNPEEKEYLKVSGRVTHSFFCFLDQHHFDTSQFHELTSIEMDFIKNPDSWMPIDLVENFLKKLTEEYNPRFSNGELTTIVGHRAVDLKAWGDLDQVIKISCPGDVYQRVEGILQWFLSPLYIRFFHHKKNLISFQCSLSSKEYPYTADYIRSVLEILPVFKNSLMKSVSWQGDLIQIHLTPFEQLSLFTADEDEREVLNPAIVKDLKKALFLLRKDYLKQKTIIERQKYTIEELKKVPRLISGLEDILRRAEKAPSLQGAGLSDFSKSLREITSKIRAVH